jgi:hypothetical protein
MSLRWPARSYPLRISADFRVRDRNQIDITLVFHLHVLMKIFHQQRALPMRSLSSRNEITGGWRSHAEENRPWIEEVTRTDWRRYFRFAPSSEMYIISCLKMKKIGLAVTSERTIFWS